MHVLLDCNDAQIAGSIQTQWMPYMDLSWVKFCFVPDRFARRQEMSNTPTRDGHPPPFGLALPLVIQ